MRCNTFFLCSYFQVIQYREQNDRAFMLLINSQRLDEPRNLDELMQYSLTPVPHSLVTTDGDFNKTNKAAMLLFLMEDAPEVVPYPKDALHIQDGNALFHALTKFASMCKIRWWLRRILSSQLIHTTMTPSSLR